MVKTRNKNTKMKKRDQARTIAKRFRVLKEKLEEASKERMEVRTVHQIKFGISFTIPDRMAIEIFLIEWL